jgi:hypothetical protein
MARRRQGNNRYESAVVSPHAASLVYRDKQEFVVQRVFALTPADWRQDEAIIASKAPSDR